MVTPGTKCRLTGIMLGEFRINLMPVPLDHLAQYETIANFALVRKEGEEEAGMETKCGKYTKGMGWSEETIKRLSALIESLEKDASLEFFAPVPPDNTGEPPQI